MTVTNTKSYNEYTSTGTETSWAFTFDVQEVGQIVVLEIDENNVETDVTASATIDLAAQTVTYGPIAAGRKLRIERRTTATQNVDLESQGPILPQVLEDALDKLTYIAQESANTVADMRNTVVKDIKYAGDWASGTYYKENQAVTLHESLYIAKVGHTADASNAPTKDASNATWALAAKRGVPYAWKGNWATGTAYEASDTVFNRGASYVCTSAHTADSSTEPGVGANWASVWDLAADQGTSIAWRGSWATGTNYAYLDAVKHNGTSYICKTAHASSAADEPGVGANWATYWDVLAEKGVDGSMAGPSSSVIGNFASFASTDGNTVADSGYSGSSFILDAPAVITPTHLDTAAAYTVGSLEAGTAITRGGSTIWGDDNFSARIAALTANTTPAGTESVACDDGQKVTLQAIADLASAGPDFISGALTCPGTLTSVSTAHGLGVVPSRLDCYIVCNTADIGYSVGDIVKITDISGSGWAVHADATNIGVSTGDAALRMPPKGGNYDAAVTVARWDLYIMAWK